MSFSPDPDALEAHDAPDAVERAASTASLAALPVGAIGEVAGFASSTDMEASLREMGFAEGDEVEVERRGPFGDVMTIRLERALIALRADEAGDVLVIRKDAGRGAS